MQKNKTRLIVVAGPQSSGKTSTLKLISDKFPHLPIINETNQYGLISKKHMGGAFVTCEIEKKILETDIKLVAEINHKLPVIVIETGIFHLVYAEYLIGKKEADQYFRNYLKAHQNLEPIVLFINTLPSVSWKRRKSIYLQRIKDNNIVNQQEKKEMLRKYRNNIYRLYPLWLKYFKKIPYKKYKINNSRKSRIDFERDIIKLISKLIV